MPATAKTADLRHIAAVVKQQRGDREWSQQHLAVVASLSRRTVQAIEAAEYRANDSAYTLLAAAFDIPLAELLGEGD